MLRFSNTAITFKTPTSGLYQLEIRYKINQAILFKDTLKSENNKIIIKGLAPNLFTITLQPVLVTNHWEKILLS
jgi:hypothetical protein